MKLVVTYYAISDELCHECVCFVMRITRELWGVVDFDCNGLSLAHRFNAVSSFDTPTSEFLVWLV